MQHSKEEVLKIEDLIEFEIKNIEGYRSKIRQYQACINLSNETIEHLKKEL